MAIFDLFYKPSRETMNREKHVGSQRKISHVSEDNRKSSEIAIIYKSELDYLSRCILDYPDIETGGQLFGSWTVTGTPIVMYAIGAGRNAKHNIASFVQDQGYLQLVGNELYRRYRLQHIGEWHSHHQLDLAYPSGGDVRTMQYGVGRPGFPRLLLCIGNCTDFRTTVNPFIFDESTPCDYMQAAWDVVEMESPFRRIVDRELSYMLEHPHTVRASHGVVRTLKNVFHDTSDYRKHWLTESVENVNMMKTFVSIIQSAYPHLTIKTEILDSGEPSILLSEIRLSIKLPYGFPTKSPVLKWAGRDRTLRNGAWEVKEEPLATAFARWVSEVAPSITYVENRENALSAQSEE